MSSSTTRVARIQCRWAAAALPGIAPVTTRTWALRGDKLEPGRETGRPPDADLTVSQGLENAVQVGPGELRQVVEEQDAGMGEADLPGERSPTAAHQAGSADAGVRRTERAPGQWLEAVAAPVDLGDLGGLLVGERRQQPRQVARQPGLAAAVGSDQHEGVAAGRGHLESALDRLLTLDRQV